MRLSILLLIASVVTLVFGLSFLIAPAAMLLQYGVQTDAGGVFMARLFASALISLGLILGLARNVSEPSTQQAIARGGCFGSLVGLGVALSAQLAGTVNALGWSTIVIYGFFTVAYATFAFRPVASPGQP